MAIAQANGLDGFGLEFLGHDVYYWPNIRTFFNACEQYNAGLPPAAKPFKLFPIINFCCGLNLTDAVALYTAFYNSSCLFRPVVDDQSRGAFSSWAAIDWTGYPNASSWDEQFFGPLAAQGFARPYFMPFSYPPDYAEHPTLSDQLAVLDGFPALDTLWYWGCAGFGDQVANSSNWTVQACTTRGKLSAVPFSAPYSPHHAGNNRYYASHGAQGLVDTWTAHVRSQPDFVIATTWNDLGEHHYIGPYNYTVGPSGSISTINAFPHAGFLQLARYFIAWFKQPPGSSAPMITPGAPYSPTTFPEQLFYFYNLQSVFNTCPGDPLGPATINADARYPAEDAVYATLLLASDVNVTITTGLTANGSGGTSTTFAVSAGLQSVQCMLLPGWQRFVVVRGSAVLANVTGSEPVNTTTASSSECNYQTFAGTVLLDTAAGSE